MSDNCILSFGVITDNHFDPAYPELAERTREAFRLLHDLEPDLLIDCGDITDFWQPEELKHFQSIFREIFADRTPEFLWLVAGHDVKNHPDYYGAYPEAAAYIDMESATPVRRINGISFVGFYQREDYAEFEKKLQQEIAASGGRPVFAVTHEPANGTVLQSDYYSDRTLREILNKYPSVIQICGHTHAPISHDRDIWQGEFTAFNAGSLTYWKDLTFGRESRRHQSYDALFCKLYGDRLEIRRYNVMTKKELASPWIVPLPFDASNAPFSPQRRKEKLPCAVFEQPNAVRFTDAGSGMLTIKHAVPHACVLRYRITLFEEEKELAVLDFYPGTWEGAAREDEEDFYFPPGMLRSGKHYRCSVAALNFFDKSAGTVEYSFTAPEMKLEQLPVSGLGPILAGEEIVSISPDGSFELDGVTRTSCRITVPEELIRYYGKKVVMVLDFPVKTPGVPL